MGGLMVRLLVSDGLVLGGGAAVVDDGRLGGVTGGGGQDI